jgi:hemoglobin-like flavoprotein
LGADFTPETKEAWTKVYTLLAGVATSAYEDGKENANSN